MDRGYAIYSGVIAPEECDALLAVHSSPLRAGTRQLMSNSAVANLASDPRLTSIAAEFVGETALPYRATLFEKTEQANWLIAWHQDTALPLHQRFDAPDWGPWTRKGGQLHAIAPAWALSRVIALRVHLDDSTQYNGPLRVIPTSHSSGVLSGPEVLALAAAGPVLECTVSRGGVIAMRPLLIHASSKSTNDQPRRVLHIEYAASLELAQGIRLAVA